MKQRLGVVAIVIAALSMASCSFGPRIEPENPESVIAGVHVGNEVAIVGKDGRISRFVVTRVTNKALYGDGFRVSYDEMKSIEVEKEDGGLFGGWF